MTVANYVVCIESFECEDEDTGERFAYNKGVYAHPESPAAVTFPENFEQSIWPVDDRSAAVGESRFAVDDDTAHESQPFERSSPPDVSDLLVCIRGFEFQDPDTGLPRFARYGIDYVSPDDWLAEHYPEFFIPVEAVLPSDRIPHLPLVD